MHCHGIQPYALLDCSHDAGKEASSRHNTQLALSDERSEAGRKWKGVVAEERYVHEMVTKRAHRKLAVPQLTQYEADDLMKTRKG